MKRRKFIQTSALASTALLTPAFLQAEPLGRRYADRSGKILVVIQLSGGNDGLNTIVPYRNDVYYRERPSLSIDQKEVLRVGDELGFHPALAPLRKWFDAGNITVINQVGYPNPDRSHFRSMDIWQTGSASDEYLSTGWIGRYLDGQCLDCPVYHALEVDDGLSLALKGKRRSGFAMSDPRRLRSVTRDPLLSKLAERKPPAEENVGYLYKTLTDTQSSARYLLEQSRVHTSSVDYPRNPFANDLKQIAALITADTDTRIYYASLGGFDTHANQRNQHSRLLGQYAGALDAFATDLDDNDLLDDVLVLTFSEFGRRVKQNGSGGTDHGTANNLSLLGGGLRTPGFFNAGPDLTHLDNEDLIHEVDFRRVYASILENWLDGDAAKVLGSGLPPLAGLV